MKMRDTEYEARRLLISPDAVPPHFQHPKIISQALKYAGILTEAAAKGPKSKLLCPMEVVLKVLPKVLQGFWLPPPNTSFNMPSQQLSKMAVGVTKAVQDREKVRQGYPQDVLVKRLNSFAAEVLNTITDVAVREICALFQPQTPQAFRPPLMNLLHKLPSRMTLTEAWTKLNQNQTRLWFHSTTSSDHLMNLLPTLPVQNQTRLWFLLYHVL
ncbi:hypothetical protein D5F01_LYC24870 [Larimichthys crocea]|uniref:Uncharacterized protein n=1 Tax=Larimichthys crocea TaxID=215358 RepID=A0A6G0HDH6_LARCR|nr:hypothetical protein D5F01_LYC24870 [Larimichthys crocea]